MAGGVLALVAGAAKFDRAEEDQLEIDDLRFVAELVIGLLMIAVMAFIASEAWAEQQRQRILRRRREALSSQRESIKRWVVEKRG